MKRDCWVTGRYLKSPHGEQHLAISLPLINLIKSFGMNPSPMWPESTPNWFLHSLEKSPALIVLSGGESVGEIEERDIFEINLLDFARSNDLPVLGICRGMQIMLHSSGGTIRLVQGHAGTRHRIFGEISGEVNSFHDFGIDEVPSNFDVLARSEDGIVEAVFEPKLKWLGIMWHPERESEIDQDQTNLILSKLGIF